MNEIDHDALADKVAEKVREHVAESYTHLARVLNEIQEGQALMAKEWATKFKLLGDTVDHLREDVEEVSLEIPVDFRAKFLLLETKLNSLQSVSSKKSIRKRVCYTIIIAVLIAIILALFADFVVVPWIKSHMLSEMYFTKQQQEGEVRDKGTVRGGMYKMTDIEIDTLQAQQERAMKGRK